MPEHRQDALRSDADLLSVCPKCGALVEDLDGFGVLAHDACGYCSCPSIDGDTCSICGRAAPSKRRVRMDLSRGGYMDVSLDPDASPETIAALRELGEAALNRMGEPVTDLIGKKATIVGYSETGDDRTELGFVAHVCLDIEGGPRVFFQATDPAATWRIVEEPRG